MDRVIVCGDDQGENLHIMQRIQALLPRCALDVRMLDDRLYHLSMLPEGTALFGSYRTLCSQELILQ